MGSLNRRQFFGLAAGTGGALALGAAGWARHRRSVEARLEDLEPVTRTSWALGTDVSITALHSDPRRAEQAIADALAELEQVERVMSLYRPDSQLCCLNREGVLRDPHPYLVDILGKALATSERTGGAFDVTVQPLWDLYAEARRAGQLPESAAIEHARGKVDWRRVEVSREDVRLNGKGTAVTLNGIAQGFAADCVMNVLRRHGIEHALVDTGETGTLGDKRAGEPWTVGIQHPRQPDAYVALARLNGRYLATSGDYATSFTPDHRLNHLFDPHTGRSPEVFASVSIAASSAWEADALATAVYVLGAEQGLQLVRSTPGADALFVFKDGRTMATAGFPV